MSDELTTPSAAAAEVDHWPAFNLTPKEYEQAVAAIAETMDLEVVGWEVKHLDSVEGLDGTYVMDVTARFRLAGMDFLILFECKRHTSAVKRSDVQVLHTKLQSIGAQKGVVVAATGFQSGALEFAKAHGIACVRLVDDAWTYVTRHTAADASLAPTGNYAGFAMTPDDDDYDFTMLTGSTYNARSALIPPDRTI
ncbi:restriction endonuclease [Nocardia fluminea]|uniref:restriction endonuclease n=1 Tax=Nocardia fluminea TaxID=134984 RepID=UPI00365161C3